MNSQTEQNKEVVVRFNKEVIERGNTEAFKTLVADSFINHTARPGTPAGPEGLIHFFETVLRPAFPDLKVEIYDQVAEGDMVTTRKAFHATHTGELMGIAATNKTVKIEVIDIVKILEGKYVEHWGINNLPSVMAQLSLK